MVNHSIVEIYFVAAHYAVAFKLAASISSPIENKLLLIGEVAIRVELRVRYQMYSVEEILEFRISYLAVIPLGAVSPSGH